MKIDKKLLEAQIQTLSNQLNLQLIDEEREHIEGLLNFLNLLLEPINIAVGYEMCNAITENDFENAVKHIQNNNGDIIAFNKFDDVAEVMESLRGWNDFEVISDEDFKEINTLLKAKESIKWCRKCDATGEGMDEGWYFEAENKCFKYESDAENYAKSLGYHSLNESYEDRAHYWTNWEVNEDYQYQEIDGLLTEIE